MTDSSLGSPISGLPVATSVTDADLFVFDSMSQPKGSRTCQVSAPALAAYVSFTGGFPLTPQAQNLVWATPSVGVGTASFRSLVTGDLPIGTSGANVPLLNGANTWSASQIMSAGAVITGGSLDSAVIGGVTPAAVTGTTVTATTFAGPPDPSFMRGYLSGLVLSNDGGTPNTVLDISAGVANAATGDVLIKLGAFTKSIAGAWAAGTGANGMGNGLTATLSTWYHVILANNAGTPDIYFDTSATGANRPAGISDTKVRRIGSFKLDASVHILAFSQDGDEFLWAAAVQDATTAAQSTTAISYALGSVPLGVKVKALFNATFLNAAISACLFTSLDQNDVAAGSPAGNSSIGNQVAAVGAAATFSIRTNTSQQIRARATAASSTLNIVTYGWVDTRGRFA